MRYTIDELAKTITIFGSPSLYKFVEVMNLRFPKDGWKAYRIEFMHEPIATAREYSERSTSWPKFYFASLDDRLAWERYNEVTSCESKKDSSAYANNISTT